MEATAVAGLLTDDDFDTGFENEIVPAGKYKVKTIKGNPRIKVSKSGNRYLNFRLAAIETLEGERVNSKIIYHTVPIEGTDKNGNPLRRMFAAFFTALGLDKTAVRSVYTGVIETAPASADIADDTEVELTLNGDRFSLDGRELMASIKVEEYEGKESNKISSVWAVKAE